MRFVGSLRYSRLGDSSGESSALYQNLWNLTYMREGKRDLGQDDIFQFFLFFLDARYELVCMTRLVAEPIQLIYGRLRTVSRTQIPLAAD